LIPLLFPGMTTHPGNLVITRSCPWPFLYPPGPLCTFADHGIVRSIGGADDGCRHGVNLVFQFVEVKIYIINNILEKHLKIKIGNAGILALDGKSG